VKLRFDGAYSGAEVFVNGTRVAAHEGGATPFEADVTDLLKPDNTLAVRLREHTDTSDRLDRMSQYADFPLLGIRRDVTLFSVPVVHVEAWRTTPRFAPRSDGSLDLTFGMVDVEASCVNESAEPFIGELTFKLTAPDGQPVALDPKAANALLEIEPWSRVTKLLRLDVANPPTWDAEHPRRFEVTALVRRRTGPRGAMRRRCPSSSTSLARSASVRPTCAAATSSSTARR
jgi:beta-galactosidase/beta-glucuronidase